jgi:aconitate hydratase
MGENLTRKILRAHLVSGEMTPGKEIAIRIDQTLTQDATGTMAYLQFEAMGIPRVKTEVSVSYVDHNMLQDDFKNADDHRYLQSVAARYGIHFSRPGNGICHQVHRERFGVPGKTLLGSDSHTPTGGGLGMLAMGAGGLDVAVAMAGGAFFLPMPKVLGIRLTGKLQPWVTGKDVILEVLRRLTVKGGVGRVLEYTGPGTASLTVADRFTITNMGAELGATTSVFPSDGETKKYMTAQGRGKDWTAVAADADATYDETLEIDLDRLEPLIAQPHSPDSVVKVRDVAGTPAQQVCIGSCTNSSFHDLGIAARMLRGRSVAPGLSMTVTPGSKQVFETIAREGALTDIISAGARILESGCGPCIGMGQAPPSGGVSVRSFNRNFEGRSGTMDAKVFLASPETCVATALKGAIADPRDAGLTWESVDEPKSYSLNDNMLLAPPADGTKTEVLRGPNIKPLPEFKPMPEALGGEVLLRMGDNITTDHIMPAGAKVLPLRSNIPAISEFVFERVDKGFVARAKEKGGGWVVGGDNYGQGSSREHAALAPKYLGVQVVLVKAFARIHLANLINFGILPLTFVNPADHDRVAQGDRLEIAGVRGALQPGKTLKVRNATKGFEFEAAHPMNQRQIDILKAGGLLPYTRSQTEGKK